MEMMMVFCGILITSGLLVFSSKREHLLSVLLSLEYISLGVFIIFLSVLASGDKFYSLYYLVFTACEGALGLSILVLMNRAYGWDYFSTFNFYL